MAADSSISYADVQSLNSALQQLASTCEDHYSSLSPFINAIQSAGLVGTAGDELIQVLNKQLSEIQDMSTFCTNVISLLSKVIGVYQQIDQAQAGQAQSLV